MRIFLSGRTAAECGSRIAGILGTRAHQVLTPAASDAADFEVAFLTREVTGRSSKLQLEPQTRAFHDALRQARSLRWLHIHSAGADRPVYAELQSRGVVVTTSSGANAPVVAQSALAGILSLARKFPMLREQQRARRWKPLLAAPPRDIAGQVAVIVGFGPIGQMLAGWLEALGMKVVVVRNSLTPAGARATHSYGQLSAAASSADWLVIACPLTDKTRGLVGKEVLAAMPAGSHVVNVARGEVVVESDLIAALEGGHLGGAFLDVFEHEPLAPDSPLWEMPNVIVTPHCAGQSGGNEERVIEMFLENLARFAEGQPLLRIAAKGAMEARGS